eukprot:Hpha_TRINITY_DN36793_c0_g1::TRINITY_DN36793_c0_g1_i1::g.142080::m.142080/K10845/TTDA, GTF2H5, TFB5; TFIIH basal transcription factor complex TTD-A subunit
MARRRQQQDEGRKNVMKGALLEFADEAVRDFVLKLAEDEAAAGRRSFVIDGKDGSLGLHLFIESSWVEFVQQRVRAMLDCGDMGRAITAVRREEQEIPRAR